MHRHIAPSVPYGTLAWLYTHARTHTHTCTSTHTDTARCGGKHQKSPHVDASHSVIGVARMKVPICISACMRCASRWCAFLLTMNEVRMTQDTPEELDGEGGPEELQLERGGPSGTAGTGGSPGGRREGEAHKASSAARRVHVDVGWQQVSAAALGTLSAALVALASGRQSGSGAWPAHSIMLVPRPLVPCGLQCLLCI